MSHVLTAADLARELTHIPASFASSSPVALGDVVLTDIELHWLRNESVRETRARIYGRVHRVIAAAKEREELRVGAGFAAFRRAMQGCE